jgi:hypothetical protein
LHLARFVRDLNPTNPGLHLAMCQGFKSY